MKQIIIIIWIFSFNQLLSQVVSSTTNKNILCCSNPPMTLYADSVDINSDNIYELKIQSMQGMDNIYYFAQGLNNTQISGANNFGTPFITYGWASMPQTPIGSYWTGWLPNSGFRYIGLRKINMPGDTTFGWVKVNFVGNQPGPIDTMKILEYAYNTTSNMHLTAGQLTSTSISEINSMDGIVIRPNVVDDYFTIENKLSKDGNYAIYSIKGELIKEGLINHESKVCIDFSQGSSGVYIVSVLLGSQMKRTKILKN